MKSIAESCLRIQEEISKVFNLDFTNAFDLDKAFALMSDKKNPANDTIEELYGLLENRNINPMDTISLALAILPEEDQKKIAGVPMEAQKILAKTVSASMQMLIEILGLFIYDAAKKGILTTAEINRLVEEAKG